MANLKKDEDKPKEEGSEADLESQKTGETGKTSVWSKLNVFRNIQHSQGTEQGMYLQDLASEEIDPEVYALYFPERSVPQSCFKTNMLFINFGFTLKGSMYFF